MQSWNIVITSPWQVVTAVFAVATAFKAIDKAWDTLLAKWKKHKAPEEAQNAEISALKTQIQQITPRLDAVEGQLTAMGKTVNDLHTGNLALLRQRTSRPKSLPTAKKLPLLFCRTSLLALSAVAMPPQLLRSARNTARRQTATLMLRITCRSSASAAWCRLLQTLC